MRYLQHQHRTDSSSNNLLHIATIAKAVGIVGLAYLAYKKRDQINDGYNKVKETTSKMVDPVVETVKKTTNQFNDFVQNKSEDAAQAVVTLSTQIEDKYHQLQGEAQDAYSNQLVSLRDKLDSLIEKAEKNKNSNENNKNANDSVKLADKSNTYPNANNSNNNKPNDNGINKQNDPLKPSTANTVGTASNNHTVTH